MLKIKVVEILKTATLLTYQKGQELLAIIQKGLVDNDKVEIDFHGYDFISSSFINNSFGQLCVDNRWDVKTFEDKITLVNIDEDDKEDIFLAILNANDRSQLIARGIDPVEHYSNTYF